MGTSGNKPQQHAETGTKSYLEPESQHQDPGMALPVKLHPVCPSRSSSLSPQWFLSTKCLLFYYMMVVPSWLHTSVCSFLTL